MTDITKQAKTIFDSYLKKVKESETKLTELEKQAHKQQTVLEQRSATEEEIEAAQRQIGTLEGERDALKGDYSEALFNADTTEQQRIFRRRNQIDAEVKEWNETILKLSKRLEDNPMDPVQAAKLSAEIHSFKEPYAMGVVKELENLFRKDYTLANRHHELKRIPLGDVDEELYHKQRMELDSTYASEQRGFEKQGEAVKREEERRAKYVSPFSTPGKVDPRVSSYRVSTPLTED